VRAWELGRPYLTWWKATVPPDTTPTAMTAVDLSRVNR
jgi:hypothetical protein